MAFWRVTVLAAGLGAGLDAAEAQEPAYQPPRAADGRPDLQGVWSGDFMTELERPDGVKGLVVAPEDAAAVIKELSWTPEGVYDPDLDYFRLETLLSVAGTLRSSWLVEPSDGKMPFTALARLAMERSDALSEYGFDNPEERPTPERCVSGMGHAPLHGVSLVIPTRIIQTRDAIMIATEDTDSGRIVHLGRPAPPEAVRTRAGYSAGRWEGDTLVVETSHIAAHDPAGVLFRGDVVVGQGSLVVERFRLLSDRELFYQFTVEDAALYDRPWLAEFVFLRQDGQVFEYACHEGNLGMGYALKAGRVGRQPMPPPAQ